MRLILRVARKGVEGLSLAGELGGWFKLAHSQARHFGCCLSSVVASGPSLFASRSPGQDSEQIRIFKPPTRKDG